MRLPSLDYREAAALWRITQPDVAPRVHATVGGIPGYRPLIVTPPTTADDFDRWVIENLLAVDVSVFTRTGTRWSWRRGASRSRGSGSFMPR